MRNFSKSKLLALRQCPKRLWLEVNSDVEIENSSATETTFRIGHSVGDVARQIYDPKLIGVLIAPFKEDIDNAFQLAIEQTKDLVKSSRQPVFEAGFVASGALAFADVLLPVSNPEPNKGDPQWRMVEVKSSTGVKDYYLDDIAIQAFVAKSAGVNLTAIALAHIDNTWVHPGTADYQGLLKEVDLTEQAFSRENEVKSWISQAQSICAQKTEPKIDTGKQCFQPYECGFYSYCTKDATKAEKPIAWLPRIGSKADELAKQGVIEMVDMPNDQLNEKQKRVKHHTLNNTVYFDAAGAAADLAPYKLPAYFLDFETINLAIPIWKGIRPYQQVCFQFSVHRLNRLGNLAHREFLDLSGDDPTKEFTKSLIEACGGVEDKSPVFVYNQAFEKSRITELAERQPRFSKALLAIKDRIVDLLPIARERYYHPNQQGSWSIKAVLPAMFGSDDAELSYEALEGVKDGGMAMDAFAEGIDLRTTATRKTQIRNGLLAYCKLDTLAMVRVWQVFANKSDK
jgi:hypothetical protein